MSTDDVDARLRQAGARWREHNRDVAAVDLIAATAGGSVPTMVPLVVDQASPLRRRRWIWLSSAAGIAAAAAAALIAARVGGSDGSGLPPASSGTQLAGTNWQLSQLRDAHGKALPLPMSSLTLDSSGQLSWSEVCSAYSGHVQVRKGSIGGLDLKQVASRGSSCPVSRTFNASPTEHELISSVLSGTVQWSVDSYTLTLTKAGVGTLTYRAMTQEPITEPKALVGTWSLVTITSPSRASANAARPADLTFASNMVSGTDGCNGISGHVTISTGRVDFGDDVVNGLVGCGADVNAESSAIDAVLGTNVTWSIQNDRLILAKDGAGALTYRRVDIDPGFAGKTGGPSSAPSATPTK